MVVVSFLSFSSEVISFLRLVFICVVVGVVLGDGVVGVVGVVGGVAAVGVAGAVLDVLLAVIAPVV